MYKKGMMLVAIFAAGLLGQRAVASTFCKQKFTFLARTGPDATFWIVEDVNGACEYSQLMQLSIVKGRPVLIRSMCEMQKDWQWLVAPMKNKRFSAEQPIELVNLDGKWRTKGVKWFVRPPEPNEQLIGAFGKHIMAGGSNGMTWNKKMGLKGAIPPVVDGFETRMMYYYPKGFYVNYDIAKIYYFPRTGYLLVFTDQKRQAVGGDTMHGFFLLRRTS